MSRLIPALIEATGLSEHDIRRIVSSAPYRYKTYAIPKRNGGLRQISQPAKELKGLQRAISAELLSRLPVHPAATAYRPGLSIRANAAAHVENGPILKFDFSEFFPSITSDDWDLYCRKSSVFENEEDISISARIMFRRYPNRSGFRLAIGAPSSPALSNAIMYDFDTLISELVANDDVTYTRYADDLTFSAKRTGFLTQVHKLLRKAVIQTKSSQLTINGDKTILATPKYKRMVTGLILTNDKKVSIGYARKRAIRAALNNEKYGRLSLTERARLAGLLAFVNDVEPEYLAKLKQKFGDSLIEELKRLRVRKTIIVQTNTTALFDDEW